MSSNGFHLRSAYLIIITGFLLSVIMAVLPHYDLSHRLKIDLLLLGMLPYALYSLFTVTKMRLSLIITGLLILGLDLFIRLPAWWGMQTREIPEQIYYTPLISSITIIPLAFLLVWILRKK
jgi:hypothetical protein